MSTTIGGGTRGEIDYGIEPQVASYFCAGKLYISINPGSELKRIRSDGLISVAGKFKIVAGA